jgi:hypothetical protein
MSELAQLLYPELLRELELDLAAWTAWHEDKAA